MPDTEPPYCGVCVAALDVDDHCPVCGLPWQTGPGYGLSEPEARVFQAAYRACDDDDLRSADGWGAVVAYRARGGHALH